MRREVEIKRGLSPIASPIAKDMKIKSCLIPFIRHIGITFLTIFLLAACAAQTEEERIAAINKRIAPEGYITKTHLYINWPALKQDDKVIAEPLKLKIPLEYLVPGLTFIDKTPIEYAEESLLVQDHKITMVSMQMLPGAKPYVPLTPTKDLPSHEAKRKSEYFRSSYNVSISNNYFKSNTTRSEHLSSVNNWLLGNYLRESDIGGLERYIQIRCYDFDELKKSETEGTHPNVLQRALVEVASKASDDHSPGNCVENRSYQYLAPSPESTPKDKSLFINCSQTSCGATFAISNRRVNIPITRVDSDSASEYERNFSNSEAGKKLFAEAKAAGKEVYVFPQPRLDEVFTDLPKWHEKVEPTRNLLDSFVVY